jgi:hypothetical protein
LDLFKWAQRWGAEEITVGKIPKPVYVWEDVSMLLRDFTVSSTHYDGEKELLTYDLTNTLPAEFTKFSIKVDDNG